jgi:hypothetical protein
MNPSTSTDQQVAGARSRIARATDDGGEAPVAG